MYLDIKGYVTCGVGLLIDPVEMALALPWVRASDSAPASQAEIRASGRVGRQRLATAGAGEAKLCTLRLTPEGVRLAALAALERTFLSLVLDFADWEEWPGDAARGAAAGVGRGHRPAPQVAQADGGAPGPRLGHGRNREQDQRGGNRVARATARSGRSSKGWPAMLRRCPSAPEAPGGHPRGG